MKKKSVLIGITSLLTLSLTSCDMLMDFINIANPSKDDSSAFSESVASSKQSIVDISTPPADDIPANRASKNYSDFTKNNVYPLSCTPSVCTSLNPVCSFASLRTSAIRCTYASYSSFVHTIFPYLLVI